MAVVTVTGVATAMAGRGMAGRGMVDRGMVVPVTAATR